MSDPWVVCCQILRLLNVPVFRKRDWSELWLEWIAQRVRNKQCHRQSETVGFTQPEKELSRVNTWTRFTGSPDSLECSRASVMFTLVLRLALQSLMNSMLEVGDWTHSFVTKATEACWSHNFKATFYFLTIHWSIPVLNCVLETLCGSNTENRIRDSVKIQFWLLSKRFCMNWGSIC